MRKEEGWGGGYCMFDAGSTGREGDVLSEPPPLPCCVCVGGGGCRGAEGRGQGAGWGGQGAGCCEWQAPRQLRFVDRLIRSRGVNEG